VSGLAREAFVWSTEGSTAELVGVASTIDTLARVANCPLIHSAVAFLPNAPRDHARLIEAKP